MKFCSSCGEKVVFRVPAGDNRERYLCEHCDTIHYQNPRIITGCLPIWQDQVLLCRRAIDPRSGFWTLPAGFLENGETTQEGALRETWEEACARVVEPSLYTLFSLPHISQIYMFYRAHLADAEYQAGEETLEVRLFDEADVPWSELAFPVVTETLSHYFSDRRAGEYPVRSQEIRRPLRTS
jgi:ADP-ribose pyrophosphatase YjhB (NUDIX family)